MKTFKSIIRNILKRNFNLETFSKISHMMTFMVLLTTLGVLNGNSPDMETDTKILKYLIANVIIFTSGVNIWSFVKGCIEWKKEGYSFSLKLDEDEEV